MTKKIRKPLSNEKLRKASFIMYDELASGRVGSIRKAAETASRELEVDTRALINRISEERRIKRLPKDIQERFEVVKEIAEKKLKQRDAIYKIKDKLDNGEAKSLREAIRIVSKNESISSSTLSSWIEDPVRIDNYPRYLRKIVNEIRVKWEVMPKEEKLQLNDIIIMLDKGWTIKKLEIILKK